MVAGGTSHGRDDELMEVLNHALGTAEPVPAEVVAGAKAAWTWRTIDAELAALSYDSLLDDRALAGVRGTDTLRALSFEASGLLIEIEVADDGDRRSLTGQLVPGPPGGAGELSIEWVDGRPPVSMAVDHVGRFAADRVPGGVVRLRLGPADGPTTVTAWVPI
jgi:hypothetical protein